LVFSDSEHIRDIESVQPGASKIRVAQQFENLVARDTGGALSAAI
jgi:hypothetical protein